LPILSFSTIDVKPKVARLPNLISEYQYFPQQPSVRKNARKERYFTVWAPLICFQSGEPLHSRAKQLCFLPHLEQILCDLSLIDPNVSKEQRAAFFSEDSQPCRDLLQSA
jgi:hypothetical protein